MMTRLVLRQRDFRSTAKKRVYVPPVFSGISTVAERKLRRDQYYFEAEYRPDGSMPNSASFALSRARSESFPEAASVNK